MEDEAEAEIKAKDAYMQNLEKELDEKNEASRQTSTQYLHKAMDCYFEPYRLSKKTLFEELKKKHKKSPARLGTPERNSQSYETPKKNSKIDNLNKNKY